MERFKKVYTQKAINVMEIWVDSDCINYLYHKEANSGGLTPLLDENGNVIITKNI